jgi:hypothetical protein
VPGAWIGLRLGAQPLCAVSCGQRHSAAVKSGWTCPCPTLLPPAHVRSSDIRRAGAEATTRHGRRTTLAAELTQAVALALGCWPGCRLAGQLAVPVGRMAQVRAYLWHPRPADTDAPVYSASTLRSLPRPLLRTILLDMDARQPVDVLPT